MRNRKGGVEGQRLADEYNKAAYAVGEWKPEEGEIVVGIPLYMKSRFAALKIGDTYFFVLSGEERRTKVLQDMKPSNKSDRDTFFQALNEIGYEYDSKKMELKEKEIVEEFKDGDFVVSTDGSIGIYGKDTGDSYPYLYAGLRLDKRMVCGLYAYKNFRKATPSEIKQLVDAMHYAGKDWDATNKRVVDLDPTDLSNLKVGDKVWSFAFGDGKVLSTDDNRMYPIKVAHNSTPEISYTKHGVYQIGGSQCLFKQPMKAVVK